MRDILQSRYLRSNVAHKQLARTSSSSLLTHSDKPNDIVHHGLARKHKNDANKKHHVIA